MNPEPESGPPNPNLPKPQPKVVSSVEYIRGLADRLEGYSRTRVVGVQATREVKMAALLLRRFADDWEEQEWNG